MSSEDDKQLAESDAQLALTVETVWRSERISCPHPHVLQSWLQGGLAKRVPILTVHQPAH